jgi:hypothetical protein
MTPKELQEKINKAREGSIDLTSEEDLALAVMNLIATEEHLFFTYEKTEKEEYLEKLNDIRALRKELMTRMIPQYEGELWCTCKHLLSATMRLNEVGTKALGKGDVEEAKDAFDKAYYVFNIFWALRLKIVELPKPQEGKPQTIGDIMNEMVNCCEE